MVEVPCKDCQSRKIPKTCENECPLWQEYMKQKQQEKKTIAYNRAIDKRLTENIWRNARK